MVKHVEKDSRENVTIFGEEMKKREMPDNGGIVWGMMLILGGALLLLNTLGIIPWSVWDNIWQFWPVLIIFWGIQVIAGRGIFGLILINTIVIIFLILVSLFAVSRVSPDLVSFLPIEMNTVFDMMEGVIR